MAGIRISEDDFVDVTVNSDYLMKRGKWKVITFDARCIRASPEELEAVGAAAQRGERGAVLSFARKVLISTEGIKDYKGASADVTEAGEGASEEEKQAHEDSLQAFMDTLPFPIDLVTKYLNDTTNKKGSRKN